MRIGDNCGAFFAPLLVVIAPALNAYLASFPLERVFKPLAQERSEG